MASKADPFLVALRGSIDLSFLNGHIYDRTIRAFIPSGEESSTRVRQAIAENQPIEALVDAAVEKIIREDYSLP